MEEYKKSMLGYETLKKKELQLTSLVLGLLSTISLFLYFDLIRVHPVVLFTIGLAISLIFAIKTKSVSLYYDRIERYLKKHHKELSKDRRFIFFLDNQLTQNFLGNEEELKILLKSKNYEEKLSKKIENSFFLYESLEKSEKKNHTLLDY